MRRLLLTVATSLLTLALLVPAAFAQEVGQGPHGPINDKVSTNAGFLMIGGIPLLILLLSLLQWRLDISKERRKQRLPKSDWSGGW